MDFAKDDILMLVAPSGDYRFGYVIETTEEAQHLLICMHDEGDSRLSYEEMAGQSVGQSPAELPIQVSKRERPVLKLLAQGQSNKLIAQTLGLAQSTVRAHVGRLRLKLRVSSREQMMVMACTAIHHIEGG